MSTVFGGLEENKPAVSTTICCYPISFLYYLQNVIHKGHSNKTIEDDIDQFETRRTKVIVRKPDEQFLTKIFCIHINRREKTYASYGKILKVNVMIEYIGKLKIEIHRGQKKEEKVKDNVDAVPLTSVYTQTYACTLDT